MRSLCGFIALLAVVCSVAGCFDPGRPLAEKASFVSEEQLVEKHFRLIEFNGVPVPQSDKTPVLEFSEGVRISGTFCNSFMAQGALLEERTLQAQPMAVTRMACSDGLLREMEEAFFVLLAQGAKMMMHDDRLVLSGEKAVFVYQGLDD